MNYRKLNEDLITMVEKTIDPDFRKMLKDTGDYQREILRKRAQYRQDQADYYNQRADERPNDVWYRNNAKDYKNDADSLTKAANAKNMNADRIYREVARYIDVQNAEMIKIPTQDVEHRIMMMFGVELTNKFDIIVTKKVELVLAEIVTYVICIIKEYLMIYSVLHWKRL